MTARPHRYPPALWDPVSYALTETRALRNPPRGWLVHVVCGDSNPKPYWETLKGKNRAFAHLCVSKTGKWWQYQDLRHWAWSCGAGNPDWWGVEVTGQPGEPMTDAQLTELAKWHVWCGARDEIANSPAGYGIGTHSMGGAAWGGHACPGPLRARQRDEIIRRAIALRAGTTLEDDVQTTDSITLKTGGKRTVGDVIGSNHLTLLALRNQTDQLESYTKAIAERSWTQNALLEAQNATLVEIRDLLKKQANK